MFIKIIPVRSAEKNTFDSFFFLCDLDGHIEDIKVRWQIHQYEINKLGEDLNKVAQTVAPYVQKIMDYSVSKYQEIRDRYVTIK